MRKYLLSACRKWTASFQGTRSAEFFLPISPCPPVVHSTHLLKPSVNALSSLLAEAISLISVLLELGKFYCMIYCGLAIISCGYVCPSREPVRARTVLTSFICSSLAQEGIVIGTALSVPRHMPSGHAHLASSSSQRRGLYSQSCTSSRPRLSRPHGLLPCVSDRPPVTPIASLYFIDSLSLHLIMQIPPFF